jgi:hypothetical protein
MRFKFDEGVLFVCEIVFDELLVFVPVVDEEDEGVEVAHHVVCHEVFVVDQVFVGVFIGVVWLVQEFVTEDGVVLPILVLLVLLIGVVVHHEEVTEEVTEEITDEDAVQKVLPVFVLLILLIGFV